MRTSTLSFEGRRRSPSSRQLKDGAWRVCSLAHFHANLLTACLTERIYPHATYERSPETSELTLVPSPSSGPPVRWSSIQDPTDTDSLPSEAHPIYITVNAGESLYLPAGWWHYVRQSEMTIAVNYWYDRESRGMSWVWLNLLRGGGKGNSPPPGNEGDEFVDSSDNEED